MPQILNPSQTSSRLTLSGGNLIATLSNQDAARQSSVARNLVNAGKWYWEVVFTVQKDANGEIGIATAAAAVTDVGPGASTNGLGLTNGSVVYNNAVQATNSLSWVANDVVGVAWDANTGLIWWKNFTSGSAWLGNSPSTGDPVAETLGYSVPFKGTAAGPAVSTTDSNVNTDSITMRFTAASFTGVVPTGYLAADLMAGFAAWLVRA